jgi:hypothetical protein
MGMGMNGFQWDSYGNPTVMGTINEHFMGMGMGRRFMVMGMKVLEMEGGFL